MKRILLMAMLVAMAAPYAVAQRVPAADSTDNRLMVDVIGNKADAQTATVGTTASLMAYMKGLLNAGGATAATATGTKADSAITTVGTTATLVSYVKGVLNQIAAMIALDGTVNDTVTSSLHGKIGTDTEMADSSLFDMLTAQNTLFGANDSTTTDSLLGRIGTDTEMADSSLFDMITAQNTLVGANDSTTTDSILGRIGTDAEMADSSLFDMITAQNTLFGANDSTTTDSLLGRIGTDAEMADSSLFDMITAQNTLAGTADDTETSSLHGKIGTDTEMADTSLYDMLVSAGSAITAVGTQLTPRTSAGVADIDISESDYTGYITLLTITPAAGGASDVIVDFDWNLATTGWDTISTAADTLDVIVQEKIDGTNYRTVAKGTQVSATGAGTLEESINGQHFDLGMCSNAGTFVVKVKLSAERNDVEIPYRVTYSGSAAATITPVAAGA